jgi:HSP20 family protein
MIRREHMSDLLKWSPFESARWTSRSGEPGKTSSQLLDTVERLFHSPGEPVSIRVEEYVDDRTLVVRAEMPGVDPDKDIEVSVADGVLYIRAERQEKEGLSDKDLFRSEFRYGSFTRKVPLPDGVKDEDITASYKDGVLEVRTLLPELARPATRERRLPINRD